MLTRKHYKLIADAINKSLTELSFENCDGGSIADHRNYAYRLFTDTLLRHLIPALREDNPRFSTVTFRKACGLDQDREAA